MNYLKYSGAGNTFVVFDGRGHDMSQIRSEASVRKLCAENGTDGLMIIDSSDSCDFRMEYYNSDGSGGMMCGNGGRCIVAFADHLGIVPADGRTYVFEAADSMHTGEVVERCAKASDGASERKIVRIRMIDAFGFRPALDGVFLNTGTRHFVKQLADVETLDIESEGPRYRHDPDFAPEGANANFMSLDPDGTLRVRTFEKGVEGETLACGTGMTACAIAAFKAGVMPARKDGDRVFYDIQARTERLAVDFVPADPAEEIFLTGPTEII